MKEFVANVLVLASTNTLCNLKLTGSVRIEQTADPNRSVCGVAEYVRTMAIISGNGGWSFAFPLKFADRGWWGVPTVSLVLDLRYDDDQTRFKTMCRYAGIRVPADCGEWTEFAIYTDHGLDGSTEEELRAHAEYLIATS